jgi:hypothetical protein
VVLHPQSPEDVGFHEVVEGEPGILGIGPGDQGRRIPLSICRPVTPAVNPGPERGRRQVEIAGGLRETIERDLA